MIEWIHRLTLPIQFFLDLLFDFFMSLFDSHGWAVIALSLAVNILLTPLQILARNWQEKERLIQERMKPYLEQFQKVYKGWQLQAFIRTLYRQNSYHPIYALRSVAGLLLQIPFLLAAFYYLKDSSEFQGISWYFIRNLGYPDELLRVVAAPVNVLPMLMFLVNVFLVFMGAHTRSARENLQLLFLASIFLVILYEQPSVLIVYWTCSLVFAALRDALLARYNKKSSEEPLSPGRWECYQNLFFKCFRYTVKELPIREKQQLSLLLALIFSFSVFLYSPLELISSGNPDDFPASFWSYLFEPVLAALLSFFALWIPARLLQSFRCGGYYTLFLLMLVAFVLINIFLFPPIYGEMTNFRFEEGVRITHATVYLSLLIYLVAVVFLWGLLSYRKIQSLTLGFSIILASLFFISAYNLWNFENQKAAVLGQEQLAGELPRFKFLRDKPNVVVVFLDRFIGGYLPGIFEDFPDLKEEYRGFVAYPNTLSSSTKTLGAISGVLGGRGYDAHQLMTQRQNVPLMDRIQESATILPYNFERIGFVNRFYPLYPYSLSELKKSPKLENTEFAQLGGRYTKRWLQEKFGVESFGEDDTGLLLTMFGLFRAFPPDKRIKIYNNGWWHRKSDQGTEQLSELSDKAENKNYVTEVYNNRTEKRRVIDNWSTLYYLSHLSKVEKTGDFSGTFHYLQSSFTHDPFYIDLRLEPIFKMPLRYSKKRFKSLGKDMFSMKHFYADAASLKVLVKWFDWMKQNGVWNNTRVILVSDHGFELKIPLIVSGTGKKSKELKREAAAFNAFLMVKDFNESGEFRIKDDSRIVSELPEIALRGLVEGMNPYTQEALVGGTHFPFYPYWIDWRKESLGKYKFKVLRRYRVDRAPILDVDNWEKLEDKTKTKKTEAL